MMRGGEGALDGEFVHGRASGTGDWELRKATAVPEAIIAHEEAAQEKGDGP
jgi:hypothetical protein